MQADPDALQAGDARPSDRASNVGPASPDEGFVELLTKYQLQLRSYIFALVRDSSAADDVMQDASVALWKMRQGYDPSRDFFRWACGVALIEVLRFRRKRRPTNCYLMRHYSIH